MHGQRGWARLNPDVITRNSPDLEHDRDADLKTEVAANGIKQPRSRSIFPGTGAVHFSTRGEYGVRMIIGKGGMLADSLAAFGEMGGVYLAIVGGAAALETTWIEQIEDVDLDDLNPESLWRFRVRGFGPLLVAMDSHGASLYTELNKATAGRRAAALASLGVK